MSQRKFAHSMRLDVWRGKLRVTCACGKQSKVLKDTEELTAREQGEIWALDHTGIKEIQPRVRKIE